MSGGERLDRMRAMCYNIYILLDCFSLSGKDSSLGGNAMKMSLSVFSLSTVMLAFVSLSEVLDMMRPERSGSIMFGLLLTLIVLDYSSLVQRPEMGQLLLFRRQLLLFAVAMLDIGGFTVCSRVVQNAWVVYFQSVDPTALQVHEFLEPLMHLSARQEVAFLIFMIIGYSVCVICYRGKEKVVDAITSL